MSGGEFDYNQYAINSIIDGIEKAIENGEDEGNEEVLQKFKDGITSLKRAFIYAHYIDRYISGDDSEKNFLKGIDGALNK